jgi:hypothetical protein
MALGITGEDDGDGWQVRSLKSHVFGLQRLQLQEIHSVICPTAQTGRFLAVSGFPISTKTLDTDK